MTPESFGFTKRMFERRIEALGEPMRPEPDAPWVCWARLACGHRVFVVIVSEAAADGPRIGDMVPCVNCQAQAARRN